MRDQLRTAARASAHDLTQWRQHLHMHPELGFQEVETTGWLAQRLEEWSIPFTRPTPTGLVGVIQGSQPGRTIAVRADIDALPIEEENDFPFKSTRPGVMHACGHDGHTAILLGLSRFLSQNRDFPGTVKLLFQPAEELPPGGAQQFIQAGVLEGVEACIGLHVIAEIPTGKAGITAGPMMANSDAFRATIRGKGGHGASPHQTIDAVMVACNAVVNLQTVVSRKVDPTKPAVISVGAIHAGQAGNVIADSASIVGTVRSFHADVRQLLHDEIQRTLEGTCAIYGATVEVQYTWGYPALVNHEGLTQVLWQAAEAVLGSEAVFTQPPIMGGEDFAYYSQKLPSAFLFLGARNDAVGANWPHHHPRFTFDEASLTQGMEILGRAALDLLEG